MGHRRFLPPDHEFQYDGNSFNGCEEHRTESIAYSQTSILQKIKAIDNFEK